MTGVLANSPKTADVKVKRIHSDAVIPTKAHDGDAGFDLFAVEDVIIEPNGTALVKTGIAVELPEGYEMQIRPRSGITLKTKLRVQFGTVDSTYRGEIGVIVDNITDKPSANLRSLANIKRIRTVENEFIDCDEAVRQGAYIIRKGEKIAQAIIQRLPSVQFTEVSELGESDRGDKGYGSTGVSE
ncbi:dUTP diphosphatase [Oceanobacillus limi]|uniref:dUTP diphosphatase n=1 Tax=Oceanobacillus limi TaxID=930131 RepID=UPI001FCCF4C2|nr:deoxyuridine 5'-triphosphate nucleotidohydrolase [Oceanobacillus limi]